MCLKKFLLFGLIAAVLPAVAEETADRKTATSLKYVEHELDTRQNKFTAESNKAMEYTDSAGTVQKRTVKSDLGTNTSDTSLPMVGGVNTKLNQKQDDIAAVNDHTAVTYTGQPGGIGQKGIYQTAESYAAQSDNLIDAKTFNAALKRGLDSEFLCSEYKPGTDLCWVWSIHNTGDNNLFTTVGATLNKAYHTPGEEVNATYPQYGYSFAHTDFIGVQPNTTYTLSITCGGYRIEMNHRVMLWDSNRGFIREIANVLCDAQSTQRKSATFTTTATTKYLTINYVYNPAGENPRLELGSSETPYTTLVPAGYTPVEYVEASSEKPIVQLGLSGNITFSFVAQSNRIKGDSQVLFASSDTGSPGTWFGESVSTQTWGAGADNSAHTNIAPTTKVSGTVSFNSSSVTGTIDGQSIIRNVNATHDVWYLFNSGNGNWPFAGKVWSLQAYQNDALVGNFIPARQGDTVGFYDTVTRTFKTNTGTGTLTAGPDINNIIYVPQNQ